MKEEFKTVAKFSDPLSAEITVGMLRENGIPASVFGISSSYPSINAALDPLEVKVNAEDYEEALRLVNTPYEEDNAKEE